MKTPFSQKTILLGVTGSIAAYKATDLASKLAQSGALVDTILTQAAMQFITPLAFQSVTARRAYTDEDLWGSEGHVLHIGLAKSADLLVIAPATANTIAKITYGLADNLLTVTMLATNCPILVAPAMDGGMYEHAATQENFITLQSRGVALLGPAEGHLASGMVGKGRMLEPAEILGYIRHTLAQGGPLQGRKVVVTAGGTQEPLDPVRFIANRSSGKQGFALAQAALDMGADVVLISAPVHLPTPVGAGRINVTTAEEMKESVLREIKSADVLLMAAAVADFRPAGPSDQKIKRRQGIPEVPLEKTPDILQEVSNLKAQSEFTGIVVGFAAESQDLYENARRKLTSKGLDLIAANDITAQDAGFAVNTNRITLLDANGGREDLPLMSKEEVALQILEHVIKLLM